MNWESNSLWKTVCLNFRTFKMYDDLNKEQREEVKRYIKSGSNQIGCLDEALAEWKEMAQDYLKSLDNWWQSNNDDISWRLHYEGSDYNAEEDYDLNRFIYGNRRDLIRVGENEDQFGKFEIGFDHFSDIEPRTANEINIEKCYLYSMFIFDVDFLPSSTSDNLEKEVLKILEPENDYIDCKLLDDGEEYFVVRKEDPSNNDFDIEVGKEVVRDLFEVMYILSGLIKDYR